MKINQVIKNLRISVIRICFEFRASNFEFEVLQIYSPILFLFPKP